MEPFHWAILIVANLPIYVGIGWVIFDDLEGFLESLRYLITPDWWSWIKGEAIEDWWAEIKIFVWLLFCGLTVYLEYWLLQKYILA